MNTITVTNKAEEFAFLKERDNVPLSIYAYIIYILDNYEEPEKKGTPRGETIGFSKVKLAACLLLLTNFKQKDIAKKLDISYGLLRLWNTEDNFKKIKEEKCEDFAHEYWQSILDSSKRLNLYANKKTALTKNEIKIFLNDILINVFLTNDLSFFSELLKRTIGIIYMNEYEHKVNIPLPEIADKHNSLIEKILYKNKATLKNVIVARCKDKVDELFEKSSRENMTEILTMLLA